MTVNYEIRIGKSLQDAWNTFLKAPEVFIALMLGQFALSFVLPRIPNLGFLLWLLVASFTIPSFVLVAEAVRRNGRASFDSLRPLLSLTPQLVGVFLVKSFLVGLGFVLLFVPGVYLLTVYAFAEVIAAVEKKTFWSAMEASRQLVKGHWFPVFGLVFVACLIVFAGFMLLGVGMLVSVPVGTLLIHAAYRDIRAQTGVIPQVIDAEIVT
jgi:uncharacterized membrane protein